MLRSIFLFRQKLISSAGELGRNPTSRIPHSLTHLGCFCRPRRIAEAGASSLEADRKKNAKGAACRFFGRGVASDTTLSIKSEIQEVTKAKGGALPTSRSIRGASMNRKRRAPWWMGSLLYVKSSKIVFSRTQQPVKALPLV